MTDRAKKPDAVALAASQGAWSISLVLGPAAAADAADGTAHDSARELADGDVEQVIARLFEELCQPVYRYVRGFVRHGSVAREVTQEVFVRLCTELAAGHRVNNVRAWLFRVAHNLAVDEQRRLRVREAHESSGEANDLACLFFSDPAPNAEHELLRRERHGWLRRAVQQLSAQERRCLFLRAQGLRYREIAEVLDIKLPTVVTFLTRAIQKLSKARP